MIEDGLLPDKKRIIIGVRPCEARGLELLDKVFDSEYKDRFYINNRDRTIIIGMACEEPDTACFCTSMNGGPSSSLGMDALLFESGDEFLVEIGTDKAGDIFSSLGKSVEGRGIKKGPEPVFQKRITVPADLDKIFESDYWRDVSNPCISCGVCTYL